MSDTTRGTATWRLLAGGVVALGAAAGAAAVAAAPVAFAAGTGYAPAAPTPGGTATGLPGSVVTVVTVPPSGGTGTATVGTATISVTVPAGTFAVPTDLVVTDASGSAITPPDGGATIVVFGIGFYQDGTKVSGTFSPVTVTVSSPSITAGSTVYFVVGTTLQSVTGAAVTAGSATFSITSDPTVEVAAAAVAAATSTAIPGATTVHTGKPFLLEGLVGGVLVVGGGATLFMLFVKRRRTA